MLLNNFKFNYWGGPETFEAPLVETNRSNLIPQPKLKSQSHYTFNFFIGFNFTHARALSNNGKCGQRPTIIIVLATGIFY